MIQNTAHPLQHRAAGKGCVFCAEVANTGGIVQNGAMLHKALHKIGGVIAAQGVRGPC